MMKTTALLLFAFLLSSCLQEKKEAVHRNLLLLNMPDKLPMTKSSAGTKLTGTRVFVSLPKGYTCDTVYHTMKKGNTAFIEAMEFKTNASSYLENFMQATRDTAVCLGYKELMLGDYKGVLLIAREGHAHKEMTGIALGKQNYVAVLRGTYTTGDSVSRKEITDILCSAYVDEHIPVNELSMSGFVCDLSGSDFEFKTKVNGKYLYMETGVLDSTKALPDVNYFQITENISARQYTLSQLKERGLKNRKDAGIVDSHIQERDLELHHHPAFERILDAVYKGKSSKFYYLILKGRTSYFLFEGNAADNKESTIAVMKKIALTLGEKRNIHEE